MYHCSELICILSNDTSMFQVAVATLIYTRKRISRLQCLLITTKTGGTNDKVDGLQYKDDLLQGCYPMFAGVDLEIDISCLL